MALSNERIVFEILRQQETKAWATVPETESVPNKSVFSAFIGCYLAGRMSEVLTSI